MSMLQANGLTAAQILRFKLAVQLQRAVCSPSCNPEVRPTRRALSVLFHPVECIIQEQSQQCPAYLTKTMTPKQSSSYIDQVAAGENIFSQKYVSVTR